MEVHTFQIIYRRTFETELPHFHDTSIQVKKQNSFIKAKRSGLQENFLKDNAEH